MKTGIYVPLITPFKENGEIDYEVLAKATKFVLAKGADGIYACGDCACLTHQPVTSWQVAKSMGICAARNAAGEDAIYQPVSVPTVVNAFGKMLTLESKEALKKAEV